MSAGLDTAAVLTEAGLDATAAAGLATAPGADALLKELGLAGEVAAGASVFGDGACAKEIDAAAKSAVIARDIRLFIRPTFLIATRTVKLLTDQGLAALPGALGSRLSLRERR